MQIDHISCTFQGGIAIPYANEINILGHFCGLRDVSALTSAELTEHCGISQADVMVLFGGSILCGGDVLASAIQADIARRYIIVGGYGHTTSSLQANMYEAFPVIQTEHMQEAEIFDAYLRHRYDLHADFLETKSTNCGNNITYLLELLNREHITCQSIILTQDATMQRRMGACLQKYKPQMQIIHFAAYQAEVVETKDGLSYTSPILGMWDMEQYITLLMGEIPRLTDDANGYGPLGRNYIAHIDIPPEVQYAFSTLKTVYTVREANPLFA